MPKMTASGKQSDAWKNLERQVAKKYLDAGFDAWRVQRGGDLGDSYFDVEVRELPFLKNDGKYKTAGFTNDALLAVTEEKYCKKKGDFAVVFTKKRGQVGCNVTMRDELWFKVAAQAFLRGKPVKGEWGCNNCQAPLTMEAKAIANLNKFTCPDCGLVIYSEAHP